MGWFDKLIGALQIFDELFLINLTKLQPPPDKEKTYGGVGEVQKKYSRKAKLNEKKFMHAN